jgi:hypothetical protein
MVTRRSTMKSRKGTKPSAVRAGSGKLEGAHSVKDAHPLEMHHMSAAQVGARLDEVESRVMRAARRFVKVGRSSMEEARIAAVAVRLSMIEAVRAIRHAARKITRQVTAAAQSV